jgi:hypothetical protein
MVNDSNLQAILMVIDTAIADDVHTTKTVA